MISKRDEGRASTDKLPYRIELCDDFEPQLLGMALNAALARAIFTAAITDYPSRRIVTRHGDTIIADSRAVSETT